MTASEILAWAAAALVAVWLLVLAAFSLVVAGHVRDELAERRLDRQVDAHIGDVLAAAENLCRKAAR